MGLFLGGRRDRTIEPVAALLGPAFLPGGHLLNSKAGHRLRDMPSSKWLACPEM